MRAVGSGGRDFESQSLKEESNQSKPNLINIPTEMLLGILSFLPVQELTKLRNMDKYLKNSVEHAILLRAKFSPDVINFLEKKYYESKNYENINKIANGIFQLENKEQRCDLNFLRFIDDNALKILMEDKDCPAEIKAALDSSPFIYFQKLKENKVNFNAFIHQLSYNKDTPWSKEFSKNLVEFFKYHSVSQFQDIYSSLHDFPCDIPHIGPQIVHLGLDAVLISILGLNGFFEEAQQLLLHYFVGSKGDFDLRLDIVSSALNLIFIDSPVNYLKVISKINQPIYYFLLKDLSFHNSERWDEILTKNPIFEKVMNSDFSNEKRMFNENDENIFNFETTSSLGYQNYTTIQNYTIISRDQEDEEIVHSEDSEDWELEMEWEMESKRKKERDMEINFKLIASYKI